jgi:hypothetical protein
MIIMPNRRSAPRRARPPKQLASHGKSSPCWRTSGSYLLSRYLKVDVLREQWVEPAARALEQPLQSTAFQTPLRPTCSSCVTMMASFTISLSSGSSKTSTRNAKAGAHEARGNWTRDTSGTRLHQLRASAAWKRSWWQTGRLMIAQQRSRILPLSRSKRRAAGWASALEAIIKKLGS